MSQSFSDMLLLFLTRSVPLFHTFLFNDFFMADFPWFASWVIECGWLSLMCLLDHFWLNLFGLQFEGQLGVWMPLIFGEIATNLLWFWVVIFKRNPQFSKTNYLIFS